MDSRALESEILIPLAVVKLLKLRLSCYVDIVNLRDTWSARRFMLFTRFVYDIDAKILLLLCHHCNEGSALVI